MTSTPEQIRQEPMSGADREARNMRDFYEPQLFRRVPGGRGWHTPIPGVKL